MYTPNQLNHFWVNLINNCACNIWLKKLTRAVLTETNSVRSSEPRILKRLQSYLIGQFVDAFFVS